MTYSTPTPMKLFTLMLGLVFGWSVVFAQNTASTKLVDRLKHELAITHNDTSRVLILARLSDLTLYLDYDAYTKYSQQGLALAKKIKYLKGEIRLLNPISIDLQIQGDIPKSLEILFKVLQTATEKHYLFEKAMCLNSIGNAYYFMADFDKALQFYKRAKKTYALVPDKSEEAADLKMFIFLNIGQAYNEWNKLDSAFFYLKESYYLTLHSEFWHPVLLYNLGDCQFKRGKYQEAFRYVNECLTSTDQTGDRFTNMEACGVMAKFFKTLNQADSAIYYAKKGLNIAQEIGYQLGILRTSKLLADQFKTTDLQQANAYFELALTTTDEIFGAKKVQALQKIISEEQERQRENERERIAAQNRIKQYGFLAGLAVLLLIASILYLNNRQKQKANALLQSKNQELEIETALERVRALTMAMRKSEELGAAIFSLFGQLKKLGITPVSSWVSLVDVDQNTMEIWTTHGDKNVKPITVYAADFENFEREINAWRDGQDIVLKTPANLSKVALKNFFNIDLIVPQQASFFHLLQIRHQFGFMGLGTWEEASLEEQRIIRRFATVFEQTYTRFLDLQKAEALAEQASLDLIKIQTEKNRAENTLAKLQSTQAQLIQSEKLASLGELTAGIAHEIQNPLNFVNNFAEVSAEMLDEMHEELEKGDTTEAIAIATDLKTNLEKINHHGQRASSIVKGMLEHSRASTGVKEPTDINALADEFLRLAYHGLRAKDNNFNATLETHFDPGLPLVSVIPQDIGRVLLNLINNAFYAVHQRASVGVTRSHADTMYQPTVAISTKRLDNTIEIRVQDNGNGIPEAIKDKIFQPFFTTKPTGQGTGLGLSLAYDIVVKGHEGKLDVESIPEEGTTFTLSLALQSN